MGAWGQGIYENLKLLDKNNEKLKGEAKYEKLRNT
ncbi:hypothetical protein QFZ77_005149 [Paenibacillus sp. V4I3]|nr:hypothetical protein [Paenibacillus sp. V4I3]MDQ0887476.1 hypothetical protein [Paenibacillus sp. V4I9]